MASKVNKGKKVNPLFMWLGIGGLLALVYVYTSGDDTTTAAKPKAAVAAKNSSTSTDAYLPVDYKATYPALKIEAKNAFLPLIRKAPAIAVGLDNGKSLPSTITGGGDWSYDGMVSVDSHVQGLLDETKSGESDYVSVGQHWKHGRIKKITDGEIVISGDDGSSATMKVGEPTAAATKSAPLPAPTPVDPSVALSGAIGGVDVNSLPPANGTGFGNGGGRRGGRRRGGGGGGGFGFGG